MSTDTLVLPGTYSASRTGGAAPRPSAPAELDRTTAPPVLLVVDDDHNIRDLLELTLDVAGFQVIMATDGSAALALARQHAPDMILLDVMMPGMSGIDVVREIRADVRLAATPVLMLSAHAEVDVVGAALLAGANGYVTKPFDVNLVTERLHTVLQASWTTSGHAPPPVTAGTYQPHPEPLQRGQEVLLAGVERGEATWVVGKVIRGHTNDLLVEVNATCAGLLEGDAFTVAMPASRRYHFARHDAQLVSVGDRALVSLRHRPSSESARDAVRCRAELGCCVTQLDSASGRFTSFASRSVDISPAGACVRLREPLTTGEPCSLVLHLPTGALHVLGVVDGCSEHFARITFRDLNRSQADLIDAHVYEQFHRQARRD